MFRISILLLSVGAASCAAPVDSSKYIPQGRWELEGSGSLTHSEDDETDTDEFEINTLMGYAITDQVQVGPLLVVDYESVDQDTPDINIDREVFGLGANVRFNIPVQNSPILPFAEAAVGLVHASVDIDTPGPGDFDEDDTSYFFQLGIGTRFLMTEASAITLALRYRFADIDDDLGGEQDQFGLFAGLALTF